MLLSVTSPEVNSEKIPIFRQSNVNGASFGFCLSEIKFCHILRSRNHVLDTHFDLLTCDNFELIFSMNYTLILSDALSNAFLVGYDDPVQINTDLELTHFLQT